jgi:hypothetical protein
MPLIGHRLEGEIQGLSPVPRKIDRILHPSDGITIAAYIISLNILSPQENPGGIRGAEVLRPRSKPGYTRCWRIPSRYRQARTLSLYFGALKNAVFPTC